LQPTEQLLWNYVREFADPKVAGNGLDGKPAFRPYQFQTAHAIFSSILLKLMWRITIRMARQMGKTEIIAISGAASALYINLLMSLNRPLAEGIPYGEEMAHKFPDGLMWGIFSPREDTGRVDYARARRMLRRVMAQYQHVGWRFEVDNETKQIAVGPGPDGKQRQLWYIEVLSAAPSAEIESRSFNYITNEECQDIEEAKIVNDILPMGTASQSTDVFVGTIGDKKGFFDKQIETNLSLHPERHFQFDYAVGIEQNFRDGWYAEAIAREILEKGEDSDSFRMMYKLERTFMRDMLMSEDTFLKLADPYELRWETEPDELAEGEVLIAGLDIARDFDKTELKVGTANWKDVRVFDDGTVTMPKMRVRWQKTYGDKPHDEQFAEIDHDLSARFPKLKRHGLIAFDGTGDRGDYTSKFSSKGYNALPVVFTGGTKPTVMDDHGEIVPGSKSHMCIQYLAGIDNRQFGYAASEKFMGTLDYYRRLNQPKPEGAPILPPSKEYSAHKAQAIACIRTWSANDRLNIIAPPKTNLHDDQIDADMLFCLAGIHYRPVSFSKVKSIGDRRIFTPSSSGILDSLRTLFS